MIVYKFRSEDYRGNISDTFSNYYKYTDVEDIRTYLKGLKTVSSLNNGDKVFIPSWVDFPRYRLREYGKIYNISITRDPVKADVIVVNKNFDGLNYTHQYKVNTTMRKTEQVISYSWNQDGEYLPEHNVNVTLSENIEELKNYPSKRFIDISELGKLVSTEGITLSEEHFDNLDRMLKTNNNEDVDLALEQMANSNYESSIVKLWTLWSINRDTCRSSQFSKSVNCKNMLNYFSSLGLNGAQSYGTSDPGLIISELYRCDIPVDIEDLSILKELLCNQIVKSISDKGGDEAGFKIRNFDVEFFLKRPELQKEQLGLNLSGLPN